MDFGEAKIAGTERGKAAQIEIIVVSNN